MCDQDFMEKIGNALPIFRAGSGSRDLPPATSDYVADSELNAWLTQGLVESEVMRISSNAGFRAQNLRRMIQVGTLWARLRSGRDSFHLRNALDRTTYEEEWSAATEEKLKESVKFGLERCSLFYGTDWVFPTDIDQGPMAKRPKTEMALIEEHGDTSTDPKPETFSSDETTYKPDKGKPMARTSDKPVDGLEPNEATDREATSGHQDIRNMFYDSEDDEDEPHNPEGNDEDDDEDGKEHEDGLIKPGTEMEKNELNHLPGHDINPDGADGDDNNIYDKKANTSKLEDVPGNLGTSVIVRHDNLFEEEEHLYNRFISFGQIEDIAGVEGSQTVPEQVIIRFASNPTRNILDLNGPSLGIFPEHEAQLWLKTDDKYLINVSGKNWPLESMKGVFLNESEVPAEVFNCSLLVKMKPRVLRGAYYIRSSIVTLRGLASLAIRRDRLTLTNANQKTKTIIPGRIDMDIEDFAAKTVILSSVDCMMKMTP